LLGAFETAGLNAGDFDPVKSVQHVTGKLACPMNRSLQLSEAGMREAEPSHIDEA